MMTFSSSNDYKCSYQHNLIVLDAVIAKVISVRYIAPNHMQYKVKVVSTFTCTLSRCNAIHCFYLCEWN